MGRTIELEDNSISITNATKGKNVYCKSDFFVIGEYYVFFLDAERLVIKRCYMDIPKKAHKCNPNKGGLGKKVFCSLDIPEGRYPIDLEESNEDQVVIYFDNDPI
jgi:hypothetical protein